MIINKCFFYKNDIVICDEIGINIENDIHHYQIMINKH
jgi:hypothetical protein